MNRRHTRETRKKEFEKKGREARGHIISYKICRYDTLNYLIVFYYNTLINYVFLCGSILINYVN